MNDIFKVRLKHILVFCGVIFVDFVSKFVAIKFFNPIYNNGIAFSLLNAKTSSFQLMILTSLISFFVLLSLLRFGNKLTALGQLGLVVVAAGGVANSIDRFAHFASGHTAAVTDFINWAGFFTGNFADIAVVLGAVALVFDVMRRK